MKVCARCKEEKPLDQFGKNRRLSDGLSHYCRDCARDASRASGKKFKMAHPERSRDIKRKSRLKNREKNRVKEREYRKAHPEKGRKSSREYAKRNRAKRREYMREWRKANSDKIAAANHRHYEKNKPKVRASNNAWDKAHPDKILGYHRKYRESNREKLRVDSLERFYRNHEANLARGKEWARKNPDKVRASGRRQDAKPHRKKPRGDVKVRVRRYRTKHLETIRARRRTQEAQRRQDPTQRVVDALRRRIRNVIRGKSKGALKLLGYSAEELCMHLEKQFKTGMSWDNYGLYGEKWHVDHKRPVSSFKLPDELAECFALENLQPLWAAENLAKNNKYDALGNPDPQTSP